MVTRNSDGTTMNRPGCLRAGIEQHGIMSCRGRNPSPARSPFPSDQHDALAHHQRSTSELAARGHAYTDLAVLRLTLYATNPYKPAIASTRATNCDEAVGTMGVVGLVLAIAGLYGLVAYNVSRRTREIGIRMALGAASSDVLRLVMGKASCWSGLDGDRLAMGFASSSS